MMLCLLRVLGVLSSVVCMSALLLAVATFLCGYFGVSCLKVKYTWRRVTVCFVAVGAAALSIILVNVGV